MVARVLKVTTALLLLGHAGLAFGQRKAVLAHHMKTLAGMIGTHDSLQYLLRMSDLIDVALRFAVLCYPASRVFLLVSRVEDCNREPVSAFGRLHLGIRRARWKLFRAVSAARDYARLSITVFSYLS